MRKTSERILVLVWEISYITVWEENSKMANASRREELQFKVSILNRLLNALQKCGGN